MTEIFDTCEANQLSEMQHRTVIAAVFIVGWCSGQRRGLKRFDRGGWPAQVGFLSNVSKSCVSHQDPSGLGPELGGWPSRVYPFHPINCLCSQNHIYFLLIVFVADESKNAILFIENSTIP